MEAADGQGIGATERDELCRAGNAQLDFAAAHPDAVTASLPRLLAARGIDRLPVDAVKVAHHGSKSNTSDEFMSLIDCPRFLISSNGAQFGHPDTETVQRLIGRADHPSLTMYFNYRSDHNAEWDDAERQAELKYRAVYPDATDMPVVVSL